MNDLDLRGKCGMCGKCCLAITIPHEPEKIAEMAGQSDDARFVHENWVRITTEEAYERNPHLLVNRDYLINKHGPDDFRVVDVDTRPYYKCTQLDTETNLCKVHENRPRVCSSYPWYGRRPNLHELFYSADCGYKIDVEDEKIRLGITTLEEAVSYEELSKEEAGQAEGKATESGPEA